ncbi:DUF4773 domain-containing protein [Caerostris darwini]|uniref:DUF4773 domain-containing protein n=1 Tax=Caerostris darwini TaxID=1538125 RepID=A0AAV4MAJ1_9ARAC|nr:DUF4773 domain-containing protein [Caerostris darwini]
MIKLLFSCVVVVVCTSYLVLGIPLKAVQKGTLPDGCVCENFTCSCCADLEVPEIWLNDTLCILFGYDPKQYGLTFVLEIDGKELINETISATNPPPICFPVPLIEDFVDGCVHFYDLSISETKFHGCAQLELRMWWIYVVAEYKLGCFDGNGLSLKHAKILKLLSKHKALNATTEISLNHI